MKIFDSECLNTNMRVIAFERHIKEYMLRGATKLTDIIALNKTLCELYNDNVITDDEYEKYCIAIFRLLYN